MGEGASDELPKLYNNNKNERWTSCLNKRCLANPLMDFSEESLGLAENH